jgi:cation diffusion facilitator family transporter
MSSHAIAIGLSAFAYAAARRYAKDSRYTLGSWKIEILAGYSSAIVLLGIAVLMAVASVERVVAPQVIHYREAILVAGVGLVVNIVCALILGSAHHRHGDADPHGHNHSSHEQSGHDLNLKSAYVHVIADAATSVFAIAALAGGWLFGWSWLDPVMGIVGAGLVSAWAKNLLAETGKVLLDREMDDPVVAEIREVIESASGHGENRVTDLHVWRVGKRAYSCALAVVTHDRNLTAGTLRGLLAQHDEIVHSTIEIQYCPDK